MDSQKLENEEETPCGECNCSTENNGSKAKENWWEIFKYTLCAASAGGVEVISAAFILWILGMTITAGDNLAEFSFLGKQMNWIAMVTQMISLTLSIIWNFTLNRKFTFKSKENIGKVLLLAFVFYIPFFPLSTLFIGWFQPILESASLSAGIAFFIAKGIAMIANLVLEFIWLKFYVFRIKK